MAADTPILVAESNDDSGFAALAAAIGRWEPGLGLERVEATERLYEPDGTLYAICLSEAAILDPERRRWEAARGDLLVLPQAVALDVEPATDWLCVRNEGPPPQHFRERFIQVWSFELLRLGQLSSGMTSILPVNDQRHALSYLLAVSEPGIAPEGSTGLDMVLAVGLEGKPSLGIPGSGATEFSLSPGSVALIGQGSRFRVAGQGRAGLLVLRNALAQHARSAAAQQLQGPEFSGPGPRESESAGPL